MLHTWSGAAARITSPTGQIAVPNGSRPVVPFTVTFDKDSPTGIALVHVEAVDAATGQVYYTAGQEFTVTKPPGFLASYMWDIIGAIIIIALIIAGILWRREIQTRKDVRGLIAILRRNGEELEWDPRRREYVSSGELNHLSAVAVEARASKVG